MKKALYLLTLITTIFCSCRKEDIKQENQTGKPLQEPVIYSISVNDLMFTADRSTNTFNRIFPGMVELKNAKITVSTDFKITDETGKELEKTFYADLTVSKPYKIQAWNEELSKEYILEFNGTGLPAVHINTPDNKKIDSKTEWMEGAEIKIYTAKGELDYEGVIEIRGRGNSTWGYPKKPYTFKLAKKAEILNMPKHKRWILLANWKDRTLLRNDAGFWLSKQTEHLPYTVRGEFVELVLNGFHQGNYYLCEQIKIDENRVNINEDKGFIIEWDTYFDEDLKFMSKKFKLPYQVKEPDPEDITAERFDDLQKFVDELEAILSDDERVRNHEWESYYDMDSAIDFMFVQELTGNRDFYNWWPFEGPHSYYLYKEDGGKLFSGPVWDFDFNTFLPDRNYWMGADRMYYRKLWKDPKFHDRAVEKWKNDKEKYYGLLEYIDQQAEYIRLSESYNHILWPISNRENGDETMTFQQSIDRMKQGFINKYNWIDQNIDKF